MGQEDSKVGFDRSVTDLNPFSFSFIHGMNSEEFLVTILIWHLMEHVKDRMKLLASIV